MKIARLLFKPRWQDKDPAVRAAAVAADSEPELIAALPELTRSDADPRVRLAALKRLGDYERWRERSTADADPAVRAKARAAYLAMLCAGGKPVPALSRLVSELETLSATELEAVAATATDGDLRRAALTYVSRPVLLAERAIADPDLQLRLSALERISDAALLERIAERTRRSDKTVSRHARERIAAMRIGSGDAGAIAARARLLCERIEALLREPGADPQAAAVGIIAEWSGLDPAAKSPLTARFEGAAALIARLRAQPATDAVPPAPSAESVPELAPASPQRADPEADPAASGDAEAGAPPQAPERVGNAVASRARFDAAVALAAEHSRRDRERHSGALQEVERLVEAFAAQLEDGDVRAANATHAKLAELAAAGGAAKAAVERRLARHEPRFAELRRWQHWSNQRRRRALCEEIEELGSAGLHPDAVATKVHEARIEWQRLDAMEGHGGGEGSGLTRHFYAACQRALKPTRVYFEKRDAVRDAHRGEFEALLTRAAALPPDSSDWKAMSALRHELGAALRALASLDPRERHAFARRIKAAIAAVSPRIEGHAREVEQARQRLITQAQALAAKADRGATRAVRELQQKWTALGAGARGTDQKQWREFRAACDAVFGALDAERKQRDTQSAEQASKAQTILADAEAVLADSSLAVEALAQRKRELESAWRGLESVERRLDQRFQQTIAAIAQRSAQLTRNRRLSRYTDALARFHAVRAFEHGEAGEGGWNTEGLGEEFAAALAQRRAGGSTVPEAEEGTSDAARDLLVRLEFLAGITSPAEDRERRMNYQVSRLSARMRGGATTGPERELTELMLAWFALPAGVPLGLERRFDAAVAAALATLP